MVISQSRSIKQGVWRGEPILSDLLLSKTLKVDASLGPTSGSAHGYIQIALIVSHTTEHRGRDGAIIVNMGRDSLITENRGRVWSTTSWPTVQNDNTLYLCTCWNVPQHPLQLLNLEGNIVHLERRLSTYNSTGSAPENFLSMIFNDDIISLRFFSLAFFPLY